MKKNAMGIWRCRTDEEVRLYLYEADPSTSLFEAHFARLLSNAMTIQKTLLLLICLAMGAGCGDIRENEPIELQLSGGQVRTSGDPSSLSLVQWNLENLFDTEDDPDNEEDDEFTPHAWRKWTEDLYELKLNHLAGVIAEADGDILCLQEVENRRVLDDLAGVLRTEFGRHYEYVLHREGSDHRGIDVAILTSIKPLSVRWLYPVREQRDIMVAEFQPSESKVTVFVNHWKSRWGGEKKSAPLRMMQAKAVRKEIDGILKDDPDASVILVGDFNDNIDQASLSEGLKSTSALSDVLGDNTGTSFYNLHGELPKHLWGTFYYRRKEVWNSFDSMSISRGMLWMRPGSKQWRVKPGSYRVVRLARHMGEIGNPIAFRRYKNKLTGEWEYVRGYSDHFPVKVELVLSHGGEAEVTSER